MFPVVYSIPVSVDGLLFGVGVSTLCESESEKVGLDGDDVDGEF